MEETKKIDDPGWDEATESGKFVKLKTDEEKKLVLINHKLMNVEKFGEKDVEFQADVVEEDGNLVEDKQFTTTSRRLKKKLRPFFEGVPTNEVVALTIEKVGEGFETQYSVKKFSREEKVE